MAQPMLDEFFVDRKKILLIEREARVRHVVRHALESVGAYFILEEHDAASARHALRWFRPDLIVLDLNSGPGDAESVWGTYSGPTEWLPGVAVQGAAICCL